MIVLLLSSGTEPQSNGMYWCIEPKGKNIRIIEPLTFCCVDNTNVTEEASIPRKEGNRLWLFLVRGADQRI